MLLASIDASISAKISWRLSIRRAEKHDRCDQLDPNQSIEHAILSAAR
jgi:hypothetical protein